MRWGHRLACLSVAVAVLALPARLHAQAGASIFGQAIGPTGLPVPNGLLYVCPYTATGKPCAPRATLYQDVNLTTPITQPYATDLYGNYSVFVAPGTYLVQVQVSPTVYYSWTQTASAGGAGNVGGSGTIAYLPQWVTNATTLGNSPIFVQSGITHMPALEGTLYANEWQSPANTGNNGIVMSLAECATYTYACQVLAPAVYAQIEVTPWGGTFGYALSSANTWITGPPASASGWIADQRFGAPQVSGVAGPVPSWAGINPNYSSDLGQEVDAIGGWTVTKGVLLEAGVGHFFRGEYVKESLRVVGSKDANECYVQATLNF